MPLSWWREHDHSIIYLCYCIRLQTHGYRGKKMIVHDDKLCSWCSNYVDWFWLTVPTTKERNFYLTYDSQEYIFVGHIITELSYGSACNMIASNCPQGGQVLISLYVIVKLVYLVYSSKLYLIEPSMSVTSCNEHLVYVLSCGQFIMIFKDSWRHATYSS